MIAEWTQVVSPRGKVYRSARWSLPRGTIILGQELDDFRAQLFCSEMEVLERVAAFLGAFQIASQLGVGVLHISIRRNQLGPFIDGMEGHWSDAAKRRLEMHFLRALDGGHNA